MKFAPHVDAQHEGGLVAAGKRLQQRRLAERELSGAGFTVIAALLSLLAALGCVVLRFRASRGTERQQLRWVAAGAVATSTPGRAPPSRPTGPSCSWPPPATLH